MKSKRTFLLLTAAAIVAGCCWVAVALEPIPGAVEDGCCGGGSRLDPPNPGIWDCCNSTTAWVIHPVTRQRIYTRVGGCVYCMYPPFNACRIIYIAPGLPKITWYVDDTGSWQPWLWLRCSINNRQFGFYDPYDMR